MRKTCDSWNTAAMVSFSRLALARSCPNGFSNTMRVQGPSDAYSRAGSTSPAAWSPLTMVPWSDGGTAR